MLKSGQNKRARQLFDESYQKVVSSEGFYKKEVVIKKLDQMEARLFKNEKLEVSKLTRHRAQPLCQATVAPRSCIDGSNWSKEK